MKTSRYTYLLLTACICISLNSHAQGVCSSTALALVFTQNLGTSAASTSKNNVPGFITNYSFNGSTTLNDGESARTSATSFSSTNISTGNSGLSSMLVEAALTNVSGNASTYITALNAFALTVDLAISLTAGSNSPVCAGNTLNLSSSASGGSTPYTYSWTGPNGFTSTVANPSIANAVSAASGTYTLVVTDNAGLTASANTVVSVNTPPPSAGPITGSNGGCRGSTFTLAGANPGGVWSTSNGAIATIDNTGVVNLVSAGTVTITYTLTANGCTTTATKNITTTSVVLHPDLIECNNGISSFNATDIHYGVTYSNNDAGNTYAWNVTGGSFSYQGASTAASQYPRMQLLTGSAFQVIVQFTTNGVTCVDTQMVYKNTVAEVTIQGSDDTTVCFNTSLLNLSGSASAVTNNISWTTSGSGVFSSPATLSTTYALSAADKAAGLIKIYLSGSSTLNSTGNCGTATSIDSMTLRIYPNNTGTNVFSTLCSKQTLTHIPVSVQAGSIFNWTSSFITGSGSGNTTSGTGTISDILINNSTTTDATVEYIITPFYNGCAGVPFTLTATIKPVPAITLTNNTTPLCSGNTTDIQFTSSVTGSYYNWSSSVISGTASGHSFNGVGSPTGLINDVLTNTSNANAIVRYRFTAITPAGCSATDSTDVLVYPLPTAANAGVDQVLCNASSASLTANTPTSGTGSWSFLSGPSTVSFANAASANTNVNGLTTGSYQLVWTIFNGVCTASKDTVMITVNPATVSGVLSSAATVCANVNSGTLSISGYTGNIIQWESSVDNGTTWTAIANTTNTYSYNNLATTTLYRTSVQSGVCTPQYSNTIFITVLQPPTIANAGADQLLSFTSSTTLAANTPTSGAGTWSFLSGPSTINFADSGLPNTSVSGLIAGSYQLIWSISNGVCTDSKDTVNITVDPPTIAGTLSADVAVCITDNTGTLTLSGHSGTIIRWEFSITNGSTWTNITNTTSSLTYTNLTTTTLYRVLVQNGVSTPLYSNNVTITVLQTATPANAGADQVLCNASSTILNGNSPVSGSGNWVFLSGPAGSSFSDNNSHNTTVNGLTVGSYQFVWSISNGVCADSKDTVSIIVNPSTVPGSLSADAIVCATSNSGTLSLSGYTGNIIQWDTSADNGATWTGLVNNANTYTYTNLSATTLFKVSVQSGVCIPQYSNNVTVTVLQAVTPANAGADQVLCNTASASLNGNIPASGNGTWTLLSGPSAVSFVNSASPNTTVSGLTAGTYQFAWTISNGLCALSKDTVSITVSAATIGGLLSGNAVVCATTNNGTLSLSGHTGAIIQWEVSIDNSTTWAVIANTTHSFVYSNLTATSLYRVLIQSGVCASQYSNIATITVNPATVAGSLSANATVCATSNSGSISLAGYTGDIAQWESSTDNGVTWSIIANTTNTLAYNNLTVTTLYRSLVQSGSCISLYSNTITITVLQAVTIANAGPDEALCNTSSFSLNANAPSSGTGIWTVVTGNATFSNTANAATTVTIAAGNTTMLAWTITNGYCAASADSMVITHYALPTTSVAGANQQQCNNSMFIMTANIPATGTGTWTLVNGSATIIDPANAATAVTVPVGTTATLAWTISNGNCSVSTSNVILINYASPTIAAAGNNQQQCNNNIFTMSANTPNMGIGVWAVVSGTASIANTANPASNVTIAAGNTATLVWIITNGNCAASTSNMVLTNFITPSTSIAGPNQQHCNNSTFTMAANTPVSGTGEWTIVNGAATINNPASPNTNVTVLAGNTATLAWSISNGSCGVSTSNVILTNYATPTIAVAGNNQQQCNNSSFIMAANTPAAGNAVWTVINGSAIINDPASPTSAITVAAGNTATLAWTIANDNCASSTGNVVLINHAMPSISVAGTNQQQCNNSTFTMAANIPVTGSGTWTVVSGSASINDLASATTNVSVTAGNTATLAWTITNGNCATSTSNIVLINYATPTVAVAGNNQQHCNNPIFTMAANIPATGTGTWTVVSGIATIADPASPTTTITVAAGNTALLAWTITNGNCNASTSNISLTNFATPTIAVAGNNQQQCNNASFIMSANTPSVGMGAWAVINGSASITNSTSNHTTVSIATGNTATLSWTITNGNCSASSSSVVLTNYAAPTSSLAGADIQQCNNNLFTLSANTPAVGAGLWTSITGTANINNATDPTTTVAVTQGVAASFVWTITNGNCAAAKDTVHVTITPLLINLTDTARQIVCYGQSVTIQGQSATGGNGTYQYQWEQSKDGTAWSTVAGATGISYSFVPAETVALRRVISSLPCTSFSNITWVIVQKALSANTIIGNQEICLGNPVQTITGSLPSGGDGNYLYQWEQSTDNGINWNIVNNAIAKNLGITTPDKTMLYRRIATTQLCNGPLSLTSNSVKVTVRPVPEATLKYKGGVYCTYNNSIDFIPTSLNADSIRWDFGDGTILTTATGKVSHTYTTPGSFVPTLQLTNMYKCAVSVTAKDTILVDEIKAGFKLSAEYDCGKTTYRFMDTSQSFFGITKRAWSINQNPISFNKNHEYLFRQAGGYETSLQVQTIHGCTNTLQAKFSVAIYTYPQVNINAINEACLNNLLELKSEINSSDSVVIRSWNLGNGGLASDSIVRVLYYSEGKYTVKLTVATVNHCYDSAYKQITIHPIPKITIAADQTICKGDSIELKAAGAMKYIWKDQNDNIICNNCTTTTVQPQKNMQYKVVGYSEYGCSQIAATTIKVIQPFRINAKYLDTLCAGETKKLVVSGAANYTWLPDASLSNLNSGSPIASPLTTTTYRVVGKDNYNCFADTADIKLVVGKPTTVSLGKDTVMLAGNSIQLNAISSIPDIRKWRWTGADFSCLNCPSPKAKIILDQCISCTVTNIYGCTTSDTICIKTFCPTTEVFIPNAFSPDGDGINDVLIVQGKGIKMIKSFRIFSRWGEMVFEKGNFLPGDPSSGWNGKVRGKPATPDVFVYVCEVICEKGTPSTFKGNVAILK